MPTNAPRRLVPAFVTPTGGKAVSQPPVRGERLTHRRESVSPKEAKLCNRILTARSPFLATKGKSFSRSARSFSWNATADMTNTPRLA